MLTGKELGDAIESARIAKGVSKKKLADDFGVAPPSVQGWVKYGRIDKAKLFQLIAYFSDVVEPSHWGLNESQERMVVSGSSWCVPLIAEQASKVISGQAASNQRLTRSGEVDAALLSIASKVSLTAMIAALSEAQKDLSDDQSQALAQAFVGFPQHSEKVVALFRAILEAAMVDALDADEIDAFATLIRKRRAEKIHGIRPIKDRANDAG